MFGRHSSGACIAVAIHGVECNAYAGTDIGLKDVRPDIYQEIMRGWRTGTKESLHIWR